MRSSISPGSTGLRAGARSKAHIDALTVEGQLFQAAQNGDVRTLSALLDEHPDTLHARARPYEWSLLHTAAQKGHLAVVDGLLKRGLDANTREKGDNTYAMHWAAAAGRLDVVRRLADAATSSGKVTTTSRRSSAGGRAGMGALQK